MTTLGGSPPLDIWVRSSGVKRLSDFLMWQVRIWSPLRQHYLCCIAHELLRRCLRMRRFISFLRIGQKLGFGTFSRLFWIIRSKCGVNKRGWGSERFLDFGIDITDVPRPAASPRRLFSVVFLGFYCNQWRFVANTPATLRRSSAPITDPPGAPSLLR